MPRNVVQETPVLDDGTHGYGASGGIDMSDQAAFEHILASLHDAMLDDARWPAVSVLIDEACGIKGNDLLVGERPEGRRPGSRRWAVPPGAAPRRPGARLPRELPPHRRTRAALSATGLRSLGAQQGSVHGRGVEDLAHLQRGAASGRLPARLERAARRAGRLPHRLESRQSCRLAWLAVVAGRDGHGVAAPYPAVCPRPAGAARRRGAEHDGYRPARQPADRRGPTGPARADHGGQRSRRRHSAARRWVGGPQRDAARPRAGRSDPSRAAGGRRAAGRRRGRGQRVDAAPPLGRVAAVRGARQAGRRPSTGLRRAARRRAGADCRAGTPSACRSGPGGHDPGSDAGGESGGGLVGGRQERAGTWPRRPDTRRAPSTGT